MRPTLTQDQFIEKAKIIHGDKYSYDNTSYKNCYEKIIITCKEHGDFYQLSNNHLQGQGCPKCRFENTRQILKFNNNDFIEKAKAIHGDKYDYSKVNYINAHKKIIIICPTHGEFEQKPGHHLEGYNCKKCRDENFKLTTEQFIEKARKVHGDIYTYDKVIYTGNKNKVIITCSKHGDFDQNSSNHLQGQGCPICKASNGEIAIKTILDKHNIKYIREYRIPDQLYKFEYDFYLPNYNILIEFHGIQHYKFVPYFHKEEDNFLKQNERDMFKRELAKLVRIPLLEFNYKQLKYMSQKQFEELVIKSIK